MGRRLNKLEEKIESLSERITSLEGRVDRLERSFCPYATDPWDKFGKPDIDWWKDHRIDKVFSHVEEGLPVRPGGKNEALEDRWELLLELKGKNNESKM